MSLNDAAQVGDLPQAEVAAFGSLPALEQHHQIGAAGERSPARARDPPVSASASRIVAGARRSYAASERMTLDWRARLRARRLRRSACSPCSGRDCRRDPVGYQPRSDADDARADSQRRAPFPACRSRTARRRARGTPAGRDAASVSIGATPSIVVTDAPSTCNTGVRQLLTSSPSTSTAHAPHSPSPQPSFVPVSCNSTRSTSSSRAIGCACTTQPGRSRVTHDVDRRAIRHGRIPPCKRASALRA